MDTPLVDLEYLKVSTDSCHRMSTCWKCKGVGTKLVRKRLNGRKQLILVDCGACDGKGIPKSLKKHVDNKPSIRPFKLTDDWIPFGPLGGIPFKDGCWDLASISFDDLPKENEMLCSLSGFWGIYQFIDGHKFTTDDVCTAGFTIKVVKEDALPVKRYMDLGTGLGSVLMMVTWNLIDKLDYIEAIEAQSRHIDLVKRSIRFNGLQDLINVHHGDLRLLDQITELRLNSFDLITGTPPYFLPREGVFSNISGRSMCAFELRGGIEVYFEAAIQLLSKSKTSRFIVCQTSLEIARTESAATLNQMAVIKRFDVFGKKGKDRPLFSIFVCGWSCYFMEDCIVQNFHVREGDSGFTQEMKDMTLELGKPIPTGH